MIREEFGPKLEELKAEVTSRRAGSRRGWSTEYFPCHAEGEELVISIRCTAARSWCGSRFPRQPDERNLCLSDYFRPERGGDVVAFQVVTVGDQASKVAEEMQEKGDYARALYLHGLAVETAEALADFWHAPDPQRARDGAGPGQALLARLPGLAGADRPAEALEAPRPGAEHRGLARRAPTRWCRSSRPRPSSCTTRARSTTP